MNSESKLRNSGRRPPADCISFRISALPCLVCSIFFSLTAQEPGQLTIEKLQGGFKFTEGPVWSRDGSLFFTDIPANKIYHCVVGEKCAEWRADSGGANGLTFDVQGRLYACEEHARRVTRTEMKGVNKGAIEVLADKWEGKRLNSPNDIVVRHDGNAYFTDPAFGKNADSAELPFHGVFRINPKGELSLVSKSSGQPNGIAISPNGRLLYVADSQNHNLRVYDLDKNGDASNERILVRGIEGAPDGMRVDEQGNIYVAAKFLNIYNPAGKLVRDIQFSETPSNLSFSEADWKTLYVTARTSVYKIRLDVKGFVPY